MSPRRPRVPRVVVETGEHDARHRSPAPARDHRAAVSATSSETARPTTPPVRHRPPAPARRAAAVAAPSTAPRPQEAAPGGEVIDLHAAQQRREEETQASAPATRPLRDPGGAASRPAPRPERRAEPTRRAGAAEARAGARRRAPLPEPVPARQITGRSLVVLAVLIIAAVLVAPTARLMLNQQLEISAAQQDIARMQDERAAYEEQIRRWDDPEYVAQQARERLALVMPGETLYTASGLPSEGTADDVGGAPVEEPVNARLPWVEGLWDSAVRAATE